MERINKGWKMVKVTESRVEERRGYKKHKEKYL